MILAHILSYRKKDWDEAILSIDRNLRDQEHSRYYGFNMAVLAHQGKIDEAKVCLDKYLEDRAEVKNSEDYAGVAPELMKILKTHRKRYGIGWIT